MKRTAYNLAIVMLAIIGQSFARADSVIMINLSYKVVLNPANGNRPPGVTDASIDTAVGQMNALQETYFRGYRFRLSEPVVQVGGLNDTGPSQWYNTNFFNANNGSAWKDQMEAAAIADPSAYAWRSNAINIYFTNGICGGICSFPSEDDNIIIIGGCSVANGPLQMHEIGHYYDRCHTQGCFCGSCQPPQTGMCHTTPGDDEISDTLPDLHCWDQNDIADGSYGCNYAACTGFQQNQVDNVFFNVMSYHANRARLTELQLDGWADWSNFTRIVAADGMTRFIQVGARGGFGSSVLPFGTVALGVAAVNPAGGDILMLRPGAFDETLTIDTPLTLRAPRTGSAIIGRASADLSSPRPAAAQAVEEILLSRFPAIFDWDPDEQIGFPGAGIPYQGDWADERRSEPEQ